MKRNAHGKKSFVIEKIYICSCHSLDNVADVSVLKSLGQNSVQTRHLREV